MRLLYLLYSQVFSVIMSLTGSYESRLQHASRLGIGVLESCFSYCLAVRVESFFPFSVLIVTVRVLSWIPWCNIAGSSKWLGSWSFLCEEWYIFLFSPLQKAVRDVSFGLVQFVWVTSPRVLISLFMLLWLSYTSLEYSEELCDIVCKLVESSDLVLESFVNSTSMRVSLLFHACTIGVSENFDSKLC